MNWMLLFMCVVIALARVLDISMDTIRTVAIVQGRRIFASILGFFQALIYIIVVAKVLQNFTHYSYAVAYAIGFSLGTYLGITLERRMALGEQLVALITRKAAELAPALRTMGYRVTEFQGRGRDGEVAALYIEVPRRDASKVVQDARQIDDGCFFMVHDVRLARGQVVGGAPPAGVAA